MDTARIAELYVPAGDRGRVGSGYRVGPDLVLTAAHVAAGLPLWPAGKPVPADAAPGACSVRPLGEQEWVPAVVAWRDEGNDVTLLRLGPKAPPLPEGSPSPRWGRVGGTEAVAVNAIGFPWAQERPGQVRDTEQIFGFIAPATTEKEGLCAVTVLTSAPADRAGGSPWAGMSGAALFAGPFLVAVVIIDPARFGTDRVVAAPIAPLLGDAELAGLLGRGRRPRGRGRAAAPAGGHRRDVSGAGPAVPAADAAAGAEPRAAAATGVRNRAVRSAATATLRPCRRGASMTPRPCCGWSSEWLGPGRPGSPPRRACGWPAGGGRPVSPTQRPPAAGRSWSSTGRRCWSLTTLTLTSHWSRIWLQRSSNWPPGTPPFRLLLLARHTIGWWDILDGHTDRAG